MAVTLPVVFCFGFVLGVAGGVGNFNPTTLATLFEIGYVVVIGIIVVVMVRAIRVPEGTSTPPSLDPPGQPPLS
jgi:hypothetical protein